MKKEKEKEPDKSEKNETAVLRKKGFEEEKKDSDDSDEVWKPPFFTRAEQKVRVVVCSCAEHLKCFSCAGNQAGCPKTIQEEAEEDEPADSGWTQTGKNIWFVFSV